MNPKTTIAALQHSVYELACSRPIEPPDRRFTEPEFRAYWEGYYFGIQMALRTMDATVDRENLRRRERWRQKTRREVA